MNYDLEYFDDLCDEMSSSLTGLGRDLNGGGVDAEEARKRLNAILDTSAEAVEELRRSTLSKTDKKELMKRLSLDTDEFEQKLTTLNEKINKLRSQEEGRSRYDSNLGSENGSDDPEKFDSQLYANMRPFSGEFLAFPQFWSIFCAYVDQTRISDVRKFQCLLDKIDERTKTKLAGYSARNYEQAKQCLLSFYLNENRLQRELIQRIDDFGDDLDLSNRDTILKFIDTLNTVEVASENAKDASHFQFHILEAVRTKLPNWLAARIPNDDKFISTAINELCFQI